MIAIGGFSVVKRIGIATAIGVLALAGVTGVCLPAHAQAADSVSDFPDVPQNHWAYNDIHELADKGLIKGYPNGQFLGDRSLTRYEFASVIVRLLAELKDLQAGAAAPSPVTQDDLDKIQVLVDNFQPELADMKKDIAQAQADILSLRQNLDDLRHDVEDTKDIADKAQATANNSYGAGPGRKYTISGYIQARSLVGSGNAQSGTNNLLYPQGKTMINSPYNGTYMSGANNAGFEDRRTRLKITGQATQNTRYAIQFDVSGNSTATPVSIREGNLAYTFNNGDASRNVTLTAGMFSNPFGYMLGFLPTSQISTERPLGFSEVADGFTGPGLSGIWAGDDYDKGATLSLPSGRTKYTAGVLSGDGYGTGVLPGTPSDHQVDGLARVAYNGGKLTGGASYYDGHLPYANATGPFSGPYTALRKQLLGLDAQYKPTQNIFLIGEYEGGKYEELDYYADATGKAVNQADLIATNFLPAPGNNIKAYYLQGGYSFNPASRHTFTIAGSYDVLDRSDSGFSGFSAATINGTAFPAAGGSGSSYDDVNWGGGLLYNLDPQTRLRLWYEDPIKVAHAPSSADPQKEGLLTSEIQASF